MQFLQNRRIPNWERLLDLKLEGGAGGVQKSVLLVTVMQAGSEIGLNTTYIVFSDVVFHFRSEAAYKRSYRYLSPRFSFGHPTTRYVSSYTS